MTPMPVYINTKNHIDVKRCLGHGGGVCVIIGQDSHEIEISFSEVLPVKAFQHLHR